MRLISTLILPMLIFFNLSAEASSKKPTKPSPFRHWYSSYQQYTSTDTRNGFSINGSIKVFPANISRFIRFDNSFVHNYSSQVLENSFRENKATGINLDCLFFLGKTMYLGPGFNWVRAENTSQGRKSRSSRWSNKLTMVHERSFKTQRYYIRFSGFSLFETSGRKTYNIYGRYEFILNPKTILRIESSNDLNPALKDTNRFLTTRLSIGFAYRL